MDAALFLGLYLVTCLGIGVGYHRLLARLHFVRQVVRGPCDEAVSKA